jgi:hypothetical protein
MRVPDLKSPCVANEGQRDTLVDVGIEDEAPNMERRHTTLHFTAMHVGNENGAPNLERKLNTSTVTTNGRGK